MPAHFYEERIKSIVMSGFDDCLDRCRRREGCAGNPESPNLVSLLSADVVRQDKCAK